MFEGCIAANSRLNPVDLLRHQSIKDIKTLIHIYIRRETFFFKPIVTSLQVFPKVDPWMIGIVFHFLVSHSEGEGVYPKETLSVFYRLMSQGVDFLNALIGHGIAANGYTAAVNHQVVAGVAFRAVIGIGVAHVER